MFGGYDSSETEENVARRLGPLREHRTLPPSQGGSRRKRNRSRRN